MFHHRDFFVIRQFLDKLVELIEFFKRALKLRVRHVFGLLVTIALGVLGCGFFLMVFGGVTVGFLRFLRNLAGGHSLFRFFLSGGT